MMMKCRPRFDTGSSRSRQTGMGMIEVLVALLVLAIGLFGVLSMQTKGLQLNQAGYYQSQAMFLAQDILERIRANREAADSYDTGGFTSTPVSGTDCETDTATCTPAQMAASDKMYWTQSLVNLLPSGAGRVSVSDVPGGNGLKQVDVQVRYVVGKLSSSDSNTYTYNLSATL